MNFLRQLFGSKKPHLDSLRFDSLGWPLRDQSKRHRTWEHPTDPALLSVDFFKLPPDLPHGLDPSTLRSLFRRSLSQQEGGLIEVTRGQVGPQPLVRTLFKLRQQPAGMGYVGSLTLPFQDYSYVVKVQAWEAGMTGLRESIVAEQLLQTGQLQFTDDGYSGWFADPYDPYYTVGTLMNRAELPEYDAQFPDHPLTLIRQSLRVLETSLRLEPELLNTPPF